MSNLKSYTYACLFLLSIGLVAVTDGRMCYQTMEGGQEAIVSCNGSCVVKVTLEGKAYACSQKTHESRCIKYSLGMICYCNYNLCLQMFDTSSQFSLLPVMNKPNSDQFKPQHRKQPKQVRQQRPFHPFLLKPSATTTTPTTPPTAEAAAAFFPFLKLHVKNTSLPKKDFSLLLLGI